ncbi:MAG: redoxin domain-containing protein, partial [Actinomycetota bacterium]
MQEHAAAFADAGVALYALSYDEVDALADYARAHGVTFPLLSDPDSAIIERLGILNTLIDPDDHPWYGIPFPGSYVLDGDGVVVAKFFEESLHFRASADQLRRAALGEEVQLPPLPPAGDRTGDHTDEGVTVDVSFDGDLLQATVIRDLLIRFVIPDGHHLYGEPVPEGMVATSVEVDARPGLVVRDPVVPATTAHTLAGTGEVLQVFDGRRGDGTLLIRVPIS